MEKLIIIMGITIENCHLDFMVAVKQNLQL